MYNRNDSCWEKKLDIENLSMKRGENDENGRKYYIYSYFRSGLSEITGEQAYTRDRQCMA